MNITLEGGQTVVINYRVCDIDGGWIIQPKLWHLVDHQQGTQEGWRIMAVFTDKGVLFSCKVINWSDDFGKVVKFKDDDEAEAWVQEQADKGSELHARALAAVTAVILRGSLE